MYIRVYAPNGEPFDVTRERADKLILQEGWTQIAPKPAKKKRFATAAETVEVEAGEQASE